MLPVVSCMCVFVKDGETAMETQCFGVCEGKMKGFYLCECWIELYDISIFLAFVALIPAGIQLY